MEDIKPLNQISVQELFRAREEAFGDYERKWANEEYIKMLHRRGYAPDLSFGAFDRERLVSFTLNGIGSFNGKPTAYDTGTATTPEYRGKGLATKIFEASLPYLKHAGITQYLLEVLQHNPKAISVYTKLGFTVRREFNYLRQEKDTLRLAVKEMPANIYLQQGHRQKEEMARLWDFEPSWQNHFESVSRNEHDFRAVGAFDREVLVGYGIIEPASGDIPQIAVDKAYRRKGIGTCILRELLVHNHSQWIQFVNTDAGCTAMTSFLENNGIQKTGMQFEMIKDLEEK